MRIQMISLTYITAFVLLLTGCQPKPVALPPGDRLGFDTWVKIFDEQANALVQSRNEQDPALLSPIQREHVLFHSLTNPDYEARLESTYLSRHGGVVVAEAWNGEPLTAGTSWTEELPLTEFHQIDLGGGEIVSRQVLYGQEFHTAAGLALDREILDTYAAAWSSGDPDNVASLYTLKAVRYEALLWGVQTGNPAIKAFARDFFSAYPGARWELLQIFGEVSEAIKIGGIFAIHLPRSFGRTCDIHTLVVLQPEGDQVAEEWVYYQADSLLKCRWMR